VGTESRGVDAMRSDGTDDGDGGIGFTRREFLQGVAGVGTVLAPVALGGCGGPAPVAAVGAQDLPGYYPPVKTGLRGSHPGSFEVAHVMRDGQALPAATSTGEVYDLVVVGGGISGLSAALLYRDRRPDALVLVLDNHDDFGGHAKRNEFWLDGELQLMNGGTYSIESPRPYSAIAEGLMRRIGIDAADLAQRAQDPGYYAAQGLSEGVFLDRETFGADHLVRHRRDVPWSQALAGAPLPAGAVAGIVRLEESPPDFLKGFTADAKLARLAAISYRDYLRDVARLEPAAIAYYQQRTHGLWGVGIDAVPAIECWAIGLPGFAGLGLPNGPAPGMGPSAAGFAATGGSIDVHPPDGGATIARALVRALVPAALKADTVDALVTARADYAALDRPGNPARIRLNSTVVKVANLGSAAEGVHVDYVRGAQTHTVLARHCVLACWNAVIPHLCPELPAEQKAALHESVKTPLVYASVAIRNWQPLARLGVAQIHAPGGYFSDLYLNECVAVGTYATPRAPERPTLLRLTRTPCSPGLSEHEQNKIGRAEILATSLERYEHEVRSQLARMLGAGGFDAGRDILAITINRWPHGYAPEFNALWDRELPEAERAHVRGRARRGAIAIANSDAAALAYMDAAIEQAQRAVGELLGA
jgi:spermidine dehydrogenase